MYIEKLVISWLAGYCPVQGEGTLNEQYNWYFRARYDYWEFILEKQPTNALANYLSKTREGKLAKAPEALFYHYEKWGEEGGFDAGYMPLEEAARFIWRACEKFLKEKKQNEEHPTGLPGTA